MISNLIQPANQGTIFHHYQSVYATLGRRAARAEQNDSDSGLTWALFVGVSDAQVERFMEENMPEVRVTAEHDCSGQFFARNPYMWRVGKRVLVRQSWGYDL